MIRRSAIAFLVWAVSMELSAPNVASGDERTSYKNIPALGRSWCYIHADKSHSKNVPWSLQAIT